MRNVPGTRIPVMYALGGAAAILVLGLIAVVALGGRSRSADNLGDGVDREPIRYGWISADTLVVPNGIDAATRPDWVRYRPPRERWTPAQIEEFWIDPAEIGVDVLRERVEARIRSLLEDIP